MGRIKMINCKACDAEITSNAKSCPQCGAKNKKPIYKRTWFIVLMVFVIIGIVGGKGSSDSDDSGSNSKDKVSENSNSNTNVDLKADIEAVLQNYPDSKLEMDGKNASIKIYVNGDKIEYLKSVIRKFFSLSKDVNGVKKWSVQLDNKEGKKVGYFESSDNNKWTIYAPTDNSKVMGTFKASDDQPIEVTVDDLYNLLSENALKAENTYQDAYIVLTGYLSTIDSDGKYISLDNGDKWSFNSVLCNLDKKADYQKEQVMNMTKGQKVVITGHITSIGEILGYSLDIETINEY